MRCACSRLPVLWCIEGLYDKFRPQKWISLNDDSSEFICNFFDSSSSVLEVNILFYLRCLCICPSRLSIYTHTWIQSTAQLHAIHLIYWSTYYAPILWSNIKLQLKIVSCSRGVQRWVDIFLFGKDMWRSSE